MSAGYAEVTAQAITNDDGSGTTGTAIDRDQRVSEKRDADLGIFLDRSVTSGQQPFIHWNGSGVLLLGPGGTTAADVGLKRDAANVAGVFQPDGSTRAILRVAAPVGDDDAARKKYVDDEIAALDLGGLDDGDAASQGTNQSLTATTWTDVAGLSVTLAGLTAATILSNFFGVVSSGNAIDAHFRIVIDGNNGADCEAHNFADNKPRTVACNHLQTGKSGSIVVKVQYKISATGTVTLQGAQNQLVALAVK